MKSPLLVLLFSFCLFTLNAQISAKLVVENPTPEINDGIARVEVDDAKGPYTFKWSKQSIELSSSICDELTEGREFSVLVTDNVGNEKLLTGVIPTVSIEEKLNSSFVPVVQKMSDFLFWDPFAFVGIYDPIIYDDAGNPELHPNGDKRTQGIPFIVVWLVLGAIFFTIKMRFINFRGVAHSFQLIAGKFDSPDDKGEVSHFQALTTALSATVGLGNIAGVAIAITLGGAGATFWMIVAGILGMASKFVECTLGVKYRRINEKGEVSGGPMYYLSKGLELKGYGWLGKVLAIVFAILCVGGSFGGGNMFQANQALSQVSNKIPFFVENGFLFGLILAVLVGLVIIGGIRSIAKVTDKIVPFMVGVYVFFALIIIFANIEQMGSAFAQIISGAFSPEAMRGGFIGVLIIGFQRAAFSNEAGVGSASIAHSCSKTDEPVSEGIVALLEPFIDTVVVCTMTALVLIFTGYAFDNQGLEGSQLTSAAFSSVFGWFDWVLLVAILLFAFSTMISWSYYGLKAWTYLIGESRAKANVYKVIFLVFIVIGSSSSLGAVLDFSDLMILGMAFPNILGLLFLVGEVRKDLKSYQDRIKSGEIRKYK
jgi:alanine or glycine:cation symporter, AGCS family